jgi:uncharacterized protein (DUF1015 family)
VYRYHVAFADPAAARTLVRKMVVCLMRAEPWAEGVVKPHEAASPAGKAAAAAQLAAQHAQLAPVLAGYLDAAGEVERLFRRVDADRPTLELTTPDRAVHRLWRVQDAEVIGKLRTVLAPKKAQVLDGHDRYEAFLDHRDALARSRALSLYSSANFVLTCLVRLDDPALIVAGRHRVIRGAPPRDAALAAARPHFLVERLAGASADAGKLRAALADTVAHQPAFVVVWPGEPDAWKLTLAPEVAPISEGVTVHRALQKYDPVVVDQLFLARAMPGAKIETVTSIEDGLAAKPGALVILRPLTSEQIGHVAELGQLLPAGSTAFTPELAPGLVTSLVDPDEDVV